MTDCKGDTVSDFPVVGWQLLVRGGSHSRLSGRALGVPRALRDRGNLPRASPQSRTHKALEKPKTLCCVCMVTKQLDAMNEVKILQPTHKFLYRCLRDRET